MKQRGQEDQDGNDEVGRVHGGERQFIAGCVRGRQLGVLEVVQPDVQQNSPDSRGHVAGINYGRNSNPPAIACKNQKSSQVVNVSTLAHPSSLRRTIC